MKKVLIRLLLIVAAIIVIALVSGLIWASFSFEAMDEAKEMSGEETDLGFVFGESDANKGVIFYQGAKVEPDAYNYLGDQLSAEGYFVVIPQMPLNLAVLSPSKANAVMEEYPDISEWYIGGHSLGGAMASSYVADHADAISGLFLLGSFSASDLSQEDVRVLDISGGLDGLATPDKNAEYDENLPPETTKVVIEKGNHANFGDYGPQKGDLVSPLTPAEQHDIVVNELTEWMAASDE
ncbi:alpha/beta hydrolase [Alkalicoccobacillus gibsonii]|uniref:Alpha/beta hydrolase n=1 Tax=Alkalicoccobacillus gibsonii TaxID=79881 RepID=A0ABU9VHE1_9BACI